MDLSGMQGGRRRPQLPLRFGGFPRSSSRQDSIRHPGPREQQRGRQLSHQGDRRQGRTSNLPPSSLAALVPHTGPAAAADRDKDAWCYNCGAQGHKQPQCRIAPGARSAAQRDRASEVKARANHYAGRGTSTRIPTLSVIEGAGDPASTFADYGLIRIALGASEEEVLNSPAGHTAILDSGFRGFELPLVNECLVPPDAFRETLKTPLKIRAASGDEILIKETATVFLKLAMAPNEVTLWSGKDRQGEKVAIQRSDGKANTPIMAYFPPCWFVSKTTIAIGGILPAMPAIALIF